MYGSTFHLAAAALLLFAGPVAGASEALAQARAASGGASDSTMHPISGTPTDAASRTSAEALHHRVTLAGGTVYFGRIVGEGDPMVIELRDGEVVRVARDRVAKVDTVRGSFVAGEFWPADPNETRLIFTATGRSLPAGGGSFNAYYGILPFVAVGITDRFTLAGGTPLFFGGGGGRLLYVAPKYQVIRHERVQASAGVLALHDTGDPNDGWYLAYGVATWEPEPHMGITLGAGWGRSDGDWSSRPALVLGADHRVDRRVRLLTENYLFPGGEGIVSAGFRILGERISADLALAAPVGTNGTFAFPLVNFSYGW